MCPCIESSSRKKHFSTMWTSILRALNSILAAVERDFLLPRFQIDCLRRVLSLQLYSLFT